jgi:invasion protein IalB
MRYFLVCFLAVSLASMAQAQPAPSLDQLMQKWNAEPEDPAMREVCSNNLKYSTEIMQARAKGATVAMLLRWAEKEAEKTTEQVPNEPLIAVGTEMVLMRLIQRSYLDAPIYSKVPGGFPQWAYRSCLKGHSLDQ